MSTPRSLDSHSLECFDMLLRERSVSRAAERMGLSQSSMSDMLSRLRERFGDPLLVRTREGMAPTERALQMVPQVRVLIDQLQALQQAPARFDAAQAQQRFRLTTSDYAQLLLLPALVQKLQATAPGCSVDILPVNIRDVERALEAGDIDVAIAYYPEPPASLRRSPLFTDRYVCIARTGHPALEQRLTAEEFAALPHVSVAPSGLAYFSHVVDAALEASSLSRRIVVSSPHFLLAAHLVSQSDLVLSLPHQAALALSLHFPLQLIEIPLSMSAVDVAMYWHERCHHSAAQQWLRARVREVLAPATAAVCVAPAPG